MLKQSARIVLASQSSARKQILGGAGLVFDIIAANLDECTIRTHHQDTGASARQIALILAEAKAMEVSAEHPESIIIGADQILELNGRIFEKPDCPAAARAQLCLLRGQSHQLYSALSVVKDNVVLWSHVERADMTMRAFDDRYLDRYIEIAGPDILDCVGCYQLEGIGARLFEQINGDYFTVLGIPLLALLSYLRKINIVD